MVFIPGMGMDGMALRNRRDPFLPPHNTLRYRGCPLTLFKLESLSHETIETIYHLDQEVGLLSWGVKLV
jgi:hypothetical protein